MDLAYSCGILISSKRPTLSLLTLGQFMRRWFLSYNSQDFDLAQRLASEIVRKDSGATVFFAPRELRPGTYWMPTLAKEIAEATAFVLLIGKSGVGSWQTVEYLEAFDRRAKERDFPIILSLLDGEPAPGLPFLRQLHWVISSDPASELSVSQTMDAAAGSGAPARELWRHTAPYRGLCAMTESDADFFFGRGRETAEVIAALAATPDKLSILLGNSGVGKSSLAQAGVLAALMGQDWPDSAESAAPWPESFDASRRWCFLKLKPGVEPVRALVEPFLWTWQFDAVDPKRAELQSNWARLLLDGKVSLRDLLDATQARYRDELHQPEPPEFLLYVDQGEELYVRAEERQRRRFSEILAQGLRDPRLRTMMSVRADFFGELQKDEALYAVHRQINVPPLRETELCKVLSRPAEMLSARFESPALLDIITRRAAEDSVKDVGALPLLSYTLDDMWTQMVKAGDGVLRLPAKAFELGGVLVDRADKFLATHPGAENALRRILTLRLATVREDGEPTRRRAPRSEFSDEEWRLVSELADHPNRLLVTARSESGEHYAEVAHEAIFRRWDKLRDWIGSEREFLAWRNGLEAARRAWQATTEGSKNDALLMGAALTQARAWMERRGGDLTATDRQFIEKSAFRHSRARRAALHVRAVIYFLLIGIIAGLVGWINQSSIKDELNWLTTMRPYMLENVRPYVLTAEAERALKPQATFRECAKDCPEMVVLPSGRFSMGSPADEQGRFDNEGPQHEVFIDRPFAVSKFDVTFAEWDACVSVGGCVRANDSGMGRGTKPVINVNWLEAQQYVTWLSTMTGKDYRLLTEAEWEYAARGGTSTAYFWGEEIGRGNANCNGCASQWDGKQTSPIGSFAPNDFGLYDMAGNVWQWVQDCYHDDYVGAPTDGSAWISGDCSRRVGRGGSWFLSPQNLRAAYRDRSSADSRVDDLGFRVARMLAP